MKKILSLLAAGLAAASVSHAALADGGAKFLGNITTSSQIRSDMGTYWNQITNENGCKWGSIHSVDANGKSVFNFNGFDSCENGYKWAKAAPGRTFKFHALIWGSQKPNFLCTKKNPGITKEKTKQYIEEWFDAVAAKFPDLEYIDVVNEAIWSGDPYNGNYHSGYSKPAAGAEGISTDDPECGGTYIVQALGGDDVVNGKHQYNFVKKAFEMARERWPKAKLIYNDYNTLSWQMNEGIEMVQTLLKAGAPIDYYGQQSHDCKGMSKSDFESKLTKIHNAVGIPLLISEYDIGEADDTKQKNDYANQIPFMWETPWIGGITIWGYINGATWAANTGIMEKDGRKRAAMVWLEEYFANNLDKGQNNTVTPVEPVPQEPFKAMTIPGKVEAEDFDVPGVGSGNDSYSTAESSNKGDSDYRKGTPVSIYKKATGNIVGYNSEGNWYEYTVDVKETGTYTVYAAVAAAGSTSSFQLSMDGKNISEVISVPAAAAGEENYDDYNKVDFDVNLTQGKHVLRLTVTGAWFDIDYMTFVAKGEKDPEPIVKDEPAENPETEEVGSAIANGLNLSTGRPDDFDVYTMSGEFVGRVSAYGMNEAINLVKVSDNLKSKGVYFLRARYTGEMKTFRIAK
ncbi:MAG: cellulase family glycosylhydrolase [Fibrobacter sp.]|nr:cellulase family glycosylhydrolase [Fibrobacter sp.]